MTSRPVGWRYESHRHYLAAKGIKTKYDANKYFYRKPAPEDPNKSYVGMLNCPWCGEGTGVLLDRRLRNTLPRNNQDIKPCDKCMPGAIILYDKDTKKHVGYMKKEAVLNPESMEKFKGTPVKALVELGPDGMPVKFVNPPEDEKYMAEKNPLYIEGAELPDDRLRMDFDFMKWWRNSSIDEKRDFVKNWNSGRRPAGYDAKKEKKISFPDPYFPGQKYEEYDEGQDYYGAPKEQTEEILRKVMAETRPDIREDDPYFHEWAERIGKGKTYAWVHAGPTYKKALIDAGYAPSEEEYAKQMMEWNYPVGSVSAEESQKGLEGIRKEFKEQFAGAQAAPKKPWTYKDSVKIVRVK